MNWTSGVVACLVDVHDAYKVHRWSGISDATLLFPPSVSFAILYDTSCESLWSSCWIRARFIPVTRILCHYPSLRSWTTVRNRLCRDPACHVKPLPPPPLPPFLFFSPRSLLLIAAPGQPRRCLRCDSDNRYWPSQELQRLFWGPLEIGWIYAYVLLRRIAIDALVEISPYFYSYYFYSSTIFYWHCVGREENCGIYFEKYDGNRWNSIYLETIHTWLISLQFTIIIFELSIKTG